MKLSGGALNAHQSAAVELHVHGAQERLRRPHLRHFARPGGTMGGTMGEPSVRPRPPVPRIDFPCEILAAAGSWTCLPPSRKSFPQGPMPKRAGKENKVKVTANPHASALQPRGGARSAAVAVEARVPFVPVPRDENDWRYAQSFEPEGEELAARTFLAEHGYVVFRNVLAPSEARESRREILAYIERVCEGFVADDESTWDAWRSQQYGMPPPDEKAYWQPQLARNRRNPRVAAGFAQLLGCTPVSLRCSHDRWALYPRGVRTRRNVHLDINPWLYANGSAVVAARRAEYAYAAADELYGGSDNLVSAEHGPHLQGTTALLDNDEEDAGFLCVPGSHRFFETWAATLDSSGSGGPRYDFPDHSHYHSMAQRVPVCEGSLIVWDARLAHGSTPDRAIQGCETRPRFVQFISLRTAQLLSEEQATRRSALVQRLYAAHSIEEPADPVQRAVAGLPRETTSADQEP